MWTGENNDQIRLPMGQTSDSEQCSYRVQFDLISILVNFSRYDFPEARWEILSNVRTDSNLTVGKFFLWIRANINKSTVGLSNKEPLILPIVSALIRQVVLKIGLLQWQNVLWDILGWFYKPGGLLYSYKVGATVHYLFYYAAQMYCIM